VNVTLPGASFTVHNWRIYAQLYNIFMFLWTFGVVGALTFMTISMCAVIWYFSAPGDRKTPPAGSVAMALRAVLRYHVGTACFGGFLIAALQLLRLALLIFEKKIGNHLGNSQTVKGVMVCVQCCLQCLERVIKFITKNAYVVTTIEGTNFIASAARALNLLVANALVVGAITVIAEYVMIFGKLFITAVTTGIGFAILRTQSHDVTSSNILVLVCIGIISYFVSCLFINILSVCIDAILLCYCVDKEGPGPHYYPTELARRVTHSHEQQSDDAKHAPLLADPPQNDGVELKDFGNKNRVHSDLLLL
jgi:hypothetical protein